MQLDQILRLQCEFDSKHGWNPMHGDRNAIFHAIEADLIGIFGEIGEFANIVKKISLELNRNNDADLAGMLRQHHADFKEEIVDVFIYLIRLAGHLEIDIEQAYIEKLKVNEHRFKRFEHPGA